MKHTGKIAPPAIMFLTDGGPTDDYESDLEDLLKNGWFVNASRSAVLLGDAIHDDAAKNAVRRFVEDPDNDIVEAEMSLRSNIQFCSEFDDVIGFNIINLFKNIDMIAEAGFNSSLFDGLKAAINYHDEFGVAFKEVMTILSKSRSLFDTVVAAM